jgi:ribonuclease BN (tRNA processing enzyme)
MPRLGSIAASLFLLAGCAHAGPPPAKPEPKGTKIVLLGTGTPIANPERSGPAVAILAGGNSYLVDVGPGIVRRAAAAYKQGHDALCMEKLTRVFVTHLHSDHTAGFPDLMLTPWVLGRKEPLQAYGPPGLENMIDHLQQAYSEDIQVRLEGLEPANPDGYKVEVHEIGPGQVYKDENVKVTAFTVKHGAWKHAYGYKFETKDRTIVVSGDTVPTESVIKACNGCDALIHEVYSKAGFDGRTKKWQAYHKASHTSAPELAKIAEKARPKLLILYHQLLWGPTPEQLLSEIKKTYKGEVVYGNDLETY